MQSTINKYTQSLPSVCIPRMYYNITQREVKTTFETIFGKGSIERIDMVLKRDGIQRYQCVFIHFSNEIMHNTTQYAIVKERLNKGLNFKIVYNDPWFWKCTVSNVVH